MTLRVVRDCSVLVQDIKVHGNRIDTDESTLLASVAVLEWFFRGHPGLHDVLVLFSIQVCEKQLQKLIKT